MQNSLYRYSAVDSRSLENLRNNLFYFSSPASFNDPFDCKSLFTLEGSSDNDWRLFFNRSLEHNEPQFSKEQRLRKVEQLIQSGIHRDKKEQAEQLRVWGEILKEKSNELGLVCLSQNRNDILMWSHYANKHYGFCLEFDKSILDTVFYCSKVRYKQKYPTFKEFVASFRKTDITELHRIFLLTKSKHWKYEKEFRLISEPNSRTDKPGERKFEYPEESLVGIIWGCQMTEKDKEKVRNALTGKSTPISYYQAKKSDSAYTLKIEKA